jgi:hypothetical protein
MIIPKDTIIQTEANFTKTAYRTNVQQQQHLLSQQIINGKGKTSGVSLDAR